MTRSRHPGRKGQGDTVTPFVPVVTVLPPLQGAGAGPGQAGTAGYPTPTREMWTHHPRMLKSAMFPAPATLSSGAAWLVLLLFLQDLPEQEQRRTGGTPGSLGATAPEKHFPDLAIPGNIHGNTHRILVTGLFR